MLFLILIGSLAGFIHSMPLDSSDEIAEQTGHLNYNALAMELFGYRYPPGHQAHRAGVLIDQYGLSMYSPNGDLRLPTDQDIPKFQGDYFDARYVGYDVGAAKNVFNGKTPKRQQGYENPTVNMLQHASNTATHHNSRTAVPASCALGPCLVVVS